MTKTNTKYKKTGIEWMPEIPEHWEVSKLKFTDDLIMGQSPDSVYYNNLFNGFPFLQGNAEFGDLYPKEKLFTTQITKIAPTNSILYSVRAPIGAVNIADKEYCIGRGLASIVPRTSILKYLYYLSLTLKWKLNNLGNGSTFTAISVSDLSNVKIPAPPIDEQKKIADYLDMQSEKINNFIDKKLNFIELLKEQRQSIINEAVTKGNINNKSIRLKYLGKIRSGEGINSEKLKTTGNYEVYGGNGFMGYTDTYNIDGLNIIIGRVGAKCGNIHLINSKKFISDNALIFNLNNGLNYEYFSIALETLNLNKLNVSTAQPLITGTKILNSYLCCPSHEEQQEIVRYIKTETSKIDIAISKTEREIELIKEYKESMIAEAVMGRLV